MRYVFYIFAALLVYMSFKSFRGGIEYLRYFRRELSKPRSGFTPFATVIVPCRGLDEGLAENLAAILEQDYPDHEVIFVVDSEDDPALDVVKLVCRDSATTAQKIKTVIAPMAVSSSQKVENLREAVLHASGESRIFAFVDSDTRPSPDWLRGLVAPLEDRSVGAATGYRWFISDKMTFGSEMRSVWNASIASALGPNRKSNFCWGGSMALRRDTFDLIGMRERWCGTLSDDFAVTAAVRQAGLDIYFVPQALTASTGDCTLAETVEFTNRQMKITRVYSPRLWMLSFFGSLVFNAVMATALAILVFSPRNDATVLFAGLVFIAVALFSIGKSWTRLRAVELVLAERWPGVRRQWISQSTLWLLSPSIFLINCISAAVSRKIVWRGIRYELKSPTETVIISD